MNAHKSGDFIADVERQFEWYAVNADWDIAERYLAAIEATCQLLVQHPLLGPVAGFSHPRLRDWRFIVVARPFQKHILFYEMSADEVLLRRAMHGHRDLLHRLVEPPESN
ncbi:MAG TPA: type II toxin-antitoxin system RelE/ParE family toxin [Verrucomicrobiae bacterium]|nr:type II toxin-antitoxin system RelE/ParE family toxin [Verrucomicrobiae bacterium]